MSRCFYWNQYGDHSNSFAAAVLIILSLLLLFAPSSRSSPDEK
jgi:hypothetical protein